MMGRKCKYASMAVLMPMDGASKSASSLGSSHMFSIAVPTDKSRQHNYALSHHQHLMSTAAHGVAEENEGCVKEGFSESAVHSLEEHDTCPHSSRKKVWLIRHEALSML